MIEYLKNNLIEGYQTSPLKAWKFSIILIFLFGLFAYLIGTSFNLYKFEIIDSQLIYILPMTLFIFPAFLEESFFRGILIPYNTKNKGKTAIITWTLLSAFLFTLWHPLNALTINPTANGIFLNPYFLIIVICLGIVCSLSYIYSQSLWVPIIIHWTTVVIWVIFLGGRNLILE